MSAGADIVAAPVTQAQAPALPPVPAAPASARPVKTWLVGPWFDLLCVANLAWPLVVLIALDMLPQSKQPFSIFLMYFLSTAHRWITVVLVFFDHDHFGSRPWKFGGLAVGLVLLGLGLAGLSTLFPQTKDGGAAENLLEGNAATGSLYLLMMLDYIWNSWHFAAQHAGISRIYGRMTRPEQTIQSMSFEKMSIRLLVLWASFRLAVYIATTYKINNPVSELLSQAAPYLIGVDVLMTVPIFVLIGRELASFRRQCTGRLVYIASVATLYIAQLVAFQCASAPVVGGLVLASGFFHATEYLAIVSWSVQRKSQGVWSHLVPRWGLTLAAFVGALGLMNLVIVWASLYVWMLMNLLVSLLHYAYDGIIWKVRPAPAKASA